MARCASEHPFDVYPGMVNLETLGFNIRKNRCSLEVDQLVNLCFVKSKTRKKGGEVDIPTFAYVIYIYQRKLVEKLPIYE